MTGVQTCALPISKLISYYQANQLNVFDEINDNCAANEFESGKLWSLLFEGHKIAYDFAGLKTMGEKVGFIVEKRQFGVGQEQIVKETFDMLPELSLFVEMIKP